MTADAKVGLLLGLFFIVVIAFLINGLPTFLRQQDAPAAAQTAVVAPSGPDLVIDQRLSETAARLSPSAPMRVSQPPQEVVVLSQTSQAAEPITLSPTPLPPALQPQEEPVIVQQVQTLPALPQPAQAKPAEPQGQVHIVQKGESLATIAQKYYGAQEGSRASAIQKLYQANKDVLESPDKIQAGSKLIIPDAPKPQKQSAAQTLLQKFSGLLEPQSPATAKPQQPERPAATAKQTPAVAVKTAEYTVQKGDTLWKIAEKTLGDGHKMNVLIEMNKDLLKNPDDIRVGMKLRVPAP